MSEPTICPRWTCPRCEDGDEACECGAVLACPGTWEKVQARGEKSDHWPKRLGGCRSRSSGVGGEP